MILLSERLLVAALLALTFAFEREATGNGKERHSGLYICIYMSALCVINVTYIIIESSFPLTVSSIAIYRPIGEFRSVQATT